jgi:hypothetical protein
MIPNLKVPIAPLEFVAEALECFAVYPAEAVQSAEALGT